MHHALALALVAHQEQERASKAAENQKEGDGDDDFHGGVGSVCIGGLRDSILRRDCCRIARGDIVMPIRCRVRWVPLAATLIVAVIGVSLGQWQSRRGDQKRAIQSRMSERWGAPVIDLVGAAVQLDIEQGEYRHVRVKGEFVSSWTSYLDNRPYRGVPGFHVLTPFKIAGLDEAVLVKRGWTPRDIDDRTRISVLPPPVGEVEIEGVLRRDAGHLLQLGTAPAPRAGAIMQNLDIPAYAAASGLKLAPFLIEQGGAMQDGLVRDWPAPSLGIERHRGYAVQWYALAMMAIIFFVVTGVRSGKK